MISGQNYSEMFPSFFPAIILTYVNLAQRLRSARESQATKAARTGKGGLK
jgi:hypothetical protein